MKCETHVTHHRVGLTVNAALVMDKQFVRVFLSIEEAHLGVDQSVLWAQNVQRTERA